jgi:hypothetical protein
MRSRPSSLKAVPGSPSARLPVGQPDQGITRIFGNSMRAKVGELLSNIEVGEDQQTHRHSQHIQPHLR